MAYVSKHIVQVYTEVNKIMWFQTPSLIIVYCFNFTNLYKSIFIIYIHRCMSLCKLHIDVHIMYKQNIMTINLHFM